MTSENSDQENHLISKSAEEAKKLIYEDQNFRKSLRHDFFGDSLRAIGYGWLIIIILVAISGYNRIGDIAEERLDSYLESKGEEFEKQFVRLSQISSYTTVTATIVVNDADSNFVPFPVFTDIQRTSKANECDWFITPQEYKGDEIIINVSQDTVDGNAGLRFTAQIAFDGVPSVGVRHAPAPRKEIRAERFPAKVFIFAKRDPE
jgi:hypothetical protein